MNNLNNLNNLNNFQYFDISQTINDKREVKGLILKNGIKVVLISDKNIYDSSCSIGINAGYLQDDFEGTAHFLEHLLFMGSEKFPLQNEYHSYVSVCGGMDNAFTGDNITCYYLEIESSFLKKGIEMLSWFFKKPLLDEKFIKSEMQIINSEHDKNILSDYWIMDDILKKFIKSSKYTKFGTGNNQSLKDITREDILKYYNRYYKTDNMYVCIVDSKSIDEMINDYIIYFVNIEENKIDKKLLEKKNIELNSENLIVYKSISKYNFLNILLFVNCDKKNQDDYEVINFIIYLIGNEYKESLSYFLLENNLIKNISVSVEYYFDDKALIYVNFMLIDDNIDNLNEVYSQFYSYLDYIKNLDVKQFELLYKNYQKIKLLHAMYSDYGSASNISNEVVENMMYGDLKLALLRNNIINNFILPTTYDIFINMITNNIIKITSNVNINNNNDFTKSKWYETKYYISEYTNIIQNTKKNNFQFNIKNIIGINNFEIETYTLLKKINKKELPELVYKNLNKEIYLLETNKYEKPFCSIIVIRKNNKLLNEKISIITSIYISLCFKILNYYLVTMGAYCCNFNISIFNGHLIYSYSGLTYVINIFINEINKMININNLFLNINTEKYFLQIKRDLIENLKNKKYSSPNQLCTNYLINIISNYLKPDEELEFIQKLSFDNFKNIIMKESLLYNYEYFIIIGIDKNKNNKNVLNNTNNYDFKNDSYLNNIIDLISLDNNKFYVKNLSCDEIEYNIINYKLKDSEFNDKEINNCLIQYGIIYNKKFNNLHENIFNKDFVYKIIKIKLMCYIASKILNEPFFDKIRTIDKLGYIVKCGFVHFFRNNDHLILLYYLVQSTSKINIIKESINNFNKSMIEDIKKNEELYNEKFSSLKKSILLDLKKPFSNLHSEIGSYLSSITKNFYIFNIDEFTYKICKKIKFHDIVKIIKIFLNDKLIKSDIILDSNKN